MWSATTIILSAKTCLKSHSIYNAHLLLQFFVPTTNSLAFATLHHFIPSFQQAKRKMGVTTYIQEFTTPVAANRMFKALILDSHNLIPKLVPQSIKSIEYVQGDGSAGSIKQTNFCEGSSTKCMKQKIDLLDVENFKCKYTIIEGPGLGDKLESLSQEICFEASGSGCKVTGTSYYHTKDDIKLTEEQMAGGKDKAMGLVKVVEEYLLANPDVYA